jgi:hypothetical protein
MSNIENQLIKELRDKLEIISETNESNIQGEQQWISNIKRLNTLVKEENPESFLQWDVIKRTMVVGNADFIDIELQFLKSLTDWEDRWKPAIKEVKSGEPTLYPEYPESSGNLIHHAYHIAQFENTSGFKVSDMNIIFEFGGGYGNMYRLLSNLGFKGKYIIFDFSQFSALQEYFIKSLGLKVLTIDNFKTANSGVLCISDLEDLRQALSQCADIKEAMFLATWSISETPISFRESILSLVTKFRYYLIAYQGQFEDNNNIEYFNLWKNTLEDFEWVSFKIEQIPNTYYRDNFYLIGNYKK